MTKPTTERKPIGYVLVDPNTGAMDWDGEIHSSYEDAISECVHASESCLEDGRPDCGAEVAYDVMAVVPVPGATTSVLSRLQALWDQRMEP